MWNGVKPCQYVWNMASDVDLSADLCGKRHLFRFAQYAAGLKLVEFVPSCCAVQADRNQMKLVDSGISSSSCCCALSCFPSGFCLIKVGLMNPAGEQRPTPREDETV